MTKKSIIFIVQLATAISLHGAEYPLHKAAATGNIEKLRKLLSRGSDVNQFKPFSGPPLHKALKHGHQEIIQELLCRPEIDINLSSIGSHDIHYTPLMEAEFYGHESVVDQLLARSDLDIQKLRPLHWASSHGNLSFATKLLRHPKRNVNIFSEKSDLTALYVAASSGNQAMMQLLIQHGADANILNYEGSSQLHRAMEHCDQKALEELLHVPCIAINVVNKNGDTPLIRAVHKGLFKSVSLLLAHGADCNVFIYGKPSPLQTAIELRYTAIALELLKSSRVNISLPNNNGDTPLHRAVSLGQTEVVQALLCAGAHVNAQNINGDTPLHCAIEKKHESIAIMLINFPGVEVDLSNKFQDSPLHRAAFLGMCAIVDRLIGAQANVNSKNIGQDTPLHRAVEEQHAPCAMRLIADASTSVMVYNRFGDTPLHRAVARYQREVAQELLAVGAQPNAQNVNGDTPLHIATSHRDVPSIYLLCNCQDTNVNISNKQRDTPLHIAAGHAVLLHYTESMEILLSCGASMGMTNNNELSPLDILGKGNCVVAERLRRLSVYYQIYALLGAQLQRTGDRSAARELPQHICRNVLDMLLTASDQK